MDDNTQAMTQGTETSQAETPAESTPVTATQAEQATPTQDTGAVDQSAPARKSLRELLASDPELKREYDEDHNRGVQKATAKQKRDFEKQRLVRAAEDPVESLTYAQERLGAMNAEDASESGITARRDLITADVNETAAKNPKWRDDYTAVLEANRGEANELFGRDPDKYRDWVDEKIEDLRVERKVDKALKERLPTLVEAQSTDKINKALQNVAPLPTGGGGGSDAALLARVAGMSLSEYKENKAAVEAAENRRIKRLTG